MDEQELEAGWALMAGGSDGDDVDSTNSGSQFSSSDGEEEDDYSDYSEFSRGSSFSSASDNLSIQSATAALGGGSAPANNNNIGNRARSSQVSHRHGRPNPFIITPALNIIDVNETFLFKDGGLKRRKTGNDSCLQIVSEAPLYSQPTTRSSTDEEALRFQHLPQLMQLAALSFLDFESLMSVRQVDRAQCDLLRSHHPATRDIIWKPACCRRWPWLDLMEKELKTGADDTTRVDFARLLSLASDTQSRSVDASLFPHNVQFTDDTTTAIQYTGVVGQGDRCIRADAPLPRPSGRIKARPLHSNFQQPVVQWQAYVEQWKPFVAPFALTSKHFSLHPRLVSYFEVTVLQRNNNDRGSFQLKPDCVAIGLGNINFNVLGSMPGWNGNSFGYHGDDGGYYHRSGWALVHNLPIFNAGDCVGCGIDYCEERVFFCKNGEFLGHQQKLTEHQLSQDWYPVVGLDSKCPVTVNFGSTPFIFDLEDFMEQYRESVANGLRR